MVERKILVSFVAVKNDVEKNVLNPDSPNYNIHKYLYNYDSHYLIYTNVEHKNIIDILSRTIKRDFPDHDLQIRNIPIKDPINLIEIRDCLYPFLHQLKDYQIDIFMSPGTPQMQIAWFLLHTSGVANTKLILGREAKYSESGRPEFFFVDIEKSSIPFAAVLKYSTPDSETELPIGKSIKPVFDKANKVALTDNVTVFIRGESGTGKEVLAKQIHYTSQRKAKPFIAVNCSAIGDDLLESRLFGHKKGSFTGAVSNHVGFFEQADGGTIFLDEIGDISPRMQQSLLRVIQESEITPLGESKSRKVNVRIITATNKNLEKLCSEQKFRWDLYYRLNVVELELPPLRLKDEKEFNQLLNYLLRKKAEKFNKKTLTITNEALNLLMRYPFPGNIRELENLIESFYVFVEQQIKEENLPERVIHLESGKSLRWEAVTREHFKKVLSLTNGNKSEAARILGCSLNTLKKYI